MHIDMFKIQFRPSFIFTGYNVELSNKYPQVTFLTFITPVQYSDKIKASNLKEFSDNFQLKGFFFIHFTHNIKSIEC